jgi:O-methyltransferase
MNEGGVILCDDYGFSDCPGAMRAMDEFFRDKQESIFHIPTGQSMVIKSARQAAA